MTKINKLNITRRNARIAVYSELIFVFAPFMAMVLVLLQKGNLDTIIASPEWSLAATVLSGQTIVRFNAGLMKHRGNKSWQVAQIYTSLILITLVVPSLIIFSIAQFQGSLSRGFAIAQIIIFGFSVLAFILLGSIGQLLLDNNSD